MSRVVRECQHSRVAKRMSRGGQEGVKSCEEGVKSCEEGVKSCQGVLYLILCSELAPID